MGKGNDASNIIESVHRNPTSNDGRLRGGQQRTPSAASQCRYTGSPGSPGSPQHTCSLSPGSSPGTSPGTSPGGTTSDPPRLSALD
ncbi:hypothetical protein NG798_05660 [Ancylothrix sp. C2]|nr:hypothetical protein [Ancylothrix sp. D3o]